LSSVLAGGYSDTGSTQSFSLNGQVELNAGGFGCAVVLGLRGSLAAGQKWTLYEVYYQSGPNYISEEWVRPPLGDPFTGFPPLPVLLNTINHGASPPAAATYFPPVVFSSANGPYRLGVRYRSAVTTGPTDTPLGLADTGQLQFAWFESELTTFDEDVGSENETVYALASLGAPGVDCSRIVSGAIDTFTCTGGPAPGGGVPIAKFSFVNINANLLDTDGIEDLPANVGFYETVAPGSFNLLDTPTFPLTAAPGGSITFDNSAVDYSGAAVSPDLFDNWLTTEVFFRGVPQTPQQTHVSNGAYSVDFTTNYPRATKNPPSQSNLSIDPAWITANGWDPNDLVCNLDQPSPISAAATYAPIAITQEAAIEIDTPAFGRPSSWTINSGANGSVTENAGDTQFIVSNVAARFTRPYAFNWRAYTTGPHGSPEWVVDGYSFLRRHYGLTYRGIAQAVYPEDYWWWNSFQFLRLNITATAPATLSLTVRGIDLTISDSHNTSPAAREAALTFSEFSDTRVYVFDVTAAANVDHFIDLSFPDQYITGAGAPFPLRRPRVESLELSSSAIGTFTLNACELTRRDAYATEVSIAYSPESTYNAEWPAVYLRVDGEATPILCYGDTDRKGMEQELGGAIRFAEGESGSVITARGMWEQLQRIEGFAIVYDDTERAAFMDDTYGVPIVSQLTEPAQFAVEVAPGAVFIGAGSAHGYEPLHCIRCGAVTFPNGLAVTIKGRHVFGGGVEAVVCVDGARAGAAVNIDVLDELNATLATVATDARGRVHYEPIGYGKTIRMEPA
jgi:hypothetical protein